MSTKTIQDDLNNLVLTHPNSRVNALYFLQKLGSSYLWSLEFSDISDETKRNIKEALTLSLALLSTDEETEEVAQMNKENYCGINY